MTSTSSSPRAAGKPAGDPRNPVIAVVGPGAIGGLVAAFLQRARHEVVLVGRQSTARRIAEHGLEVVTDRFGSWHAPLHATTAVPRGARVLVAVKAEGVVAAADLVAAARPTEVVALLNGLEHMDVLRAAVASGDGASAPPVVGATIAGETLRTGHDRGTEPGGMTVRHRGDLLRVVVPDAAADLHVVRALRGTEIEVVTGGTEAEVLWKKLRFLAPHALLTSTWRTGIGDAIDADPALADALLAEVAAVATAEGVPTTGDELLGILRGLHRTMRSSLQADLEAGRPGELDAIGGAVARRAAAHGVATPVLDELLARLAGRVSRR